MLLTWYESEDCLLEPSDAPFRDEPDGDDVVVSVDTGEPWYETVSDWIVAAYLAFTFTPAAGLFYITTLRNIRLQFRARNYGAIAQIFLDDVLQVEVDTYSPVDEIIDIFIRGEAPPGFSAFDVETHQIRIVHSGEHNPEATASPDGFAVEVVRDYIGLEAGTRYYNPETDEIEVLVDGVWTPIDPAADPRRISTLPPRETADPRCDAAENLTAGIETWIEANINAFTLGASAASLTSIFFLSFPFLGIFGKIIGIVEGLIAALFTAGSSGVEAAFTEEAYDSMKCYFFDAMDADGRMTQATLQEVEDRLFDAPGGTVYNVMRYLFATIGEGGLNDMAATGTLEGACDDCAPVWGYRWDFAESDGGFVYDAEIAYTAGHWNTAEYAPDLTGHSCSTTANYFDLGRKSADFDIPAESTITKLFMNASVRGGDACNHIEMFVGASRGEGLGRDLRLYTTGASGNPLEATGEITAGTGQHLGFGTNDAGGDGVITLVALEGTGIMPDFTGGEAYIP